MVISDDRTTRPSARPRPLCSGLPPVIRAGGRLL
jgi:hypothetical protein